MKLGKSYSVAYSKNGRYLATCSASKIFIWTLGSCTGTSDAKSVRVKDPSDLVFAPDSKSLLVKTTSGALHLICTDSSRALRKIRGPTSEGARPAFSSDGDSIIDGAWNGITSMVDVRTGIASWEKSWAFEMITHVLPSADHRTWLFLHSPKATLPNAPPDPCYFSEWDYPFSDRPVRVVAPGVRLISAAAITPDAKYVAVLYGAPPTHLAVIDLSDGLVRYEITTDTGGTGTFLAWSANGRVLGSVERGRVAFYADDLTELGHFDLDYPCSIAFAHDSTTIAVGSWCKGHLLGPSETSEITRRRLTPG